MGLLGILNPILGGLLGGAGGGGGGGGEPLANIDTKTNIDTSVQDIQNSDSEGDLTNVDGVRDYNEFKKRSTKESVSIISLRRLLGNIEHELFRQSSLL